MQGKIWTIAALCALALLGSAYATKADDGSQLHAQVTQSYPSLRYVERYRHDFPDEVQGQASGQLTTPRLPFPTPMRSPVRWLLCRTSISRWSTPRRVKPRHWACCSALPATVV
jgi:hypothetical protein